MKWGRVLSAAEALQILCDCVYFRLPFMTTVHFCVCVCVCGKMGVGAAALSVKWPVAAVSSAVVTVSRLTGHLWALTTHTHTHTHAPLRAFEEQTLKVRRLLFLLIRPSFLLDRSAPDHGHDLNLWRLQSFSGQKKSTNNFSSLLFFVFCFFLKRIQRVYNLLGKSQVIL